MMTIRRVPPCMLTTLARGAVFLLCLLPAAASAASLAQDVSSPAAGEAAPGKAGELHLQAEAALTRGDKAAAASLLQQAIAADPSYWPSLCRMGELNLAGGRAAEAEPLLRKAVTINPQHGPCLSRFAQALLMTGRELEAEEPLRRASELMPDDSGVVFNLGRLYEGTNRPGPAIEAYRRFLTMTSTDPQRTAGTRLRMARLLVGERRSEEAIPEYQRYVQDAPDRHEVRGELALTLTAVSRYPEALAEYEKIIAAGKGTADGLARAGAICLLMRDVPRAVEYLERAVKEDPQSIMARLDLGKALGQAGDHARAVELLSAVAAEAPEDERVHYLLAQSLQKLGRTEEAKKEMEKHQAVHEKMLKKHLGEDEPQGHD